MCLLLVMDGVWVGLLTWNIVLICLGFVFGFIMFVLFVGLG